MKKMKWEGSETEFLEFMMFVDTVLCELSDKQKSLNYPAILESARLIELFIEVDYKEFENFFDLRMNGRAEGIFFYGLLRLKKLLMKSSLSPSA